MNENYGIHLASLTSLPPSVVMTARGFISKISSSAHRVPPLDRQGIYIPDIQFCTKSSFFRQVGVFIHDIQFCTNSSSFKDWQGVYIQDIQFRQRVYIHDIQFCTKSSYFRQVGGLYPRYPVLHKEFLLQIGRGFISKSTTQRLKMRIENGLQEGNKVFN